MPESNPHHGLTPRSGSLSETPAPAVRYTLGAGFVALLVLMLVITVVGVRNLQSGQDRLERVAAQHMEKTRLASAMRNAARERTVSLQKMILLSDPFDRDEQWMRFNERAGEFARLRGVLTGVGLESEEVEFLSRQSGITGVAVPTQEEVARLAMAERTLEAHRLLVNKAIPLQDKVMAVLDEFQAFQERRAEEAVQQARTEYDRARTWMVLLSAMMLVLGALVAITVLVFARRGERALRQEKERAQVTLHSLGEAVIRAGSGSCVEYLNPVAERLTGWTAQEAIHRPLAEVLRLLRDTSREPISDPVAVAGSQGGVVSYAEDTLLVARDGAERAIELTITTAADRDGAVLVFRDVTEMRALSRELAYQATHDPMTGLLNRREFERRLQRAMDDTRREEIEHALCYLDLDLFKTVNDTCGHLAGDELLKQLSMQLREHVRKEDILARVGGDEFAILLLGCGMDKAAEIGEEVRKGLKDYHFVWEDKRLDIGTSVGIVPVGAASGDINDVLRAADVACRLAKEDGRNRLHVLRPNDLTITKRQREINWVQRLRHAIDHDEFILMGQWILPLGDKGSRTPFCEILLQLNDSGGTVGPAVFLPAAERYHLMPLIDRWVARTVFQKLKTICPSNDVCFNINLSGQTLCDSEFLTYVQRELADSGVPPTCLGFEITETAAVTHMSRAVQFINTLRRIGCRFSLDDFGSGLSSFNYLKNMPVDYLKIDGAFVRNCPEEATDFAMVASINQVAHILGIQTVAEYVESESIRDAMVRTGVDYGQGIAIAVPQPLDGLLQKLLPGLPRAVNEEHS